jgi:hypothetical protein
VHDFLSYENYSLLMGSPNWMRKTNAVIRKAADAVNSFSLFLLFVLCFVNDLDYKFGL